MSKQKKYTLDFSLDLKGMVLNGEISQMYLNKEVFGLKKEFEKHEEDCEFAAAEDDLCLQMLKSENEFEMGKLLFERFDFLDRRQASDIGFWNYLSHTQLYAVIHKLWPHIDNPPNFITTENYIASHWIIDSAAHSYLMKNPLAGMWWSFFLSIDIDRKDKYELTKIFFKNYTFRTITFGQAKLARNKEAVIGVLEFIVDNKLHETNFEDNGRAITPFLNLLGGIKPLGFFNRDWFKQKLTNKFQLDIEIYQKLFRRNERPESSIIKVDEDVIKSVNNTSPKNNKKTDLKNPEKVLFYLNLFGNGDYSLNHTIDKEAEWNVPIRMSQTMGYLIQCYDNGRVNKIPISNLLGKKTDKIYQNGMSHHKLLKIQCISDEALLLIRSGDRNGNCFIKIHDLEHVASHSQLSLMGNEITKMRSKLKYQVIPSSLKNDLKRITFKSSEANVVVSNSYYNREWKILKPFMEKFKICQD